MSPLWYHCSGGWSLGEEGSKGVNAGGVNVQEGTNLGGNNLWKRIKTVIIL
jgi:hypothetical protein